MLLLVLDLGMGQPMEQALRICRPSARLGQALRLGPGELAEVYCVALLWFLGWTGDAHETAHIVGGDGLAFRGAPAPAFGRSSPGITARALPEVGSSGSPNRQRPARWYLSAGGHANTVGCHIRRVYARIGVATRAGVADFALEPGVLPK